MDVKISMIKGAPVWDALPVYKIIHYPLEKRDYKPFAQARFCINERDLYLRLWAFETRPSEKSVLTAVFDFTGEGKRLAFTVDSLGGLESTVGENGKQKSLAEYGVLPELHSYRGEDLEGEYWGVVIKLPRQAIETVYGADPVAPGYRITAGVYKEDTAPGSAHHGSLFPVDMTAAEPFGQGSFGEFVFVDF